MKTTRRGGAAALASAAMISSAFSVGLVAQPAQAATALTDYTFSTASATLADVRRVTRADVAHSRGYTGKGIGVALIDTGVVPVPGLTSGNVANGPDLSLESQVAGLARRDTYGHGTHMAGIIAGRDATGGPFRGMAPDAKVTSIKVGIANGAVDVTQVMAAIDWVVEHRNDDPANPIRVLNLSYGTTGVMSNTLNPLSHAVQNAHRAGITVFVAAGNTGGAITNPAFDPYVTTVGGTDMKGTTNPADDQAASFSSLGTTRTPDLLLPGKSIVSLRNPGSYADTAYPAARVGERYFVGSGTSRAAAAAAGAAATLLQRHPSLKPDGVKCTLLYSGGILPVGKTNGGRMINLDTATANAPRSCTVSGPVSTGTGSIQTSRGNSIMTLDGVALTGERDIFGPLSSATWAAASKAGTSWQGGNWMGRPWTGTGWDTASNGQANWSGRYWSGTSWSGRYWSALAWSGATWTGSAWSNTTVNGVTWAGTSWTGVSWLSSGNGTWMR